MTVKIEGDNIIITLPYDKSGQLSASKKSIVLATTKGNKPSDLEIDGKAVMIGVNVYVSAK